MDILMFPDYLINQFLSFLDINDYVNAMKCCKVFNKTIKNYGFNVNKVQLTNDSSVILMHGYPYFGEYLYYYYNESIYKPFLFKNINKLYIWYGWLQGVEYFDMDILNELKNIQYIDELSIGVDQRIHKDINIQHFMNQLSKCFSPKIKLNKFFINFYGDTQHFMVNIDGFIPMFSQLKDVQINNCVLSQPLVNALFNNKEAINSIKFGPFNTCDLSPETLNHISGKLKRIESLRVIFWEHWEEYGLKHLLQQLLSKPHIGKLAFDNEKYLSNDTWHYMISKCKLESIQNIFVSEFDKLYPLISMNKSIHLNTILLRFDAIKWIQSGTLDYYLQLCVQDILFGITINEIKIDIIDWLHIITYLNEHKSNISIQKVKWKVMFTFDKHEIKLKEFIESIKDNQWIYKLINGVFIRLIGIKKPQININPYFKFHSSNKTGNLYQLIS